MAMDLDFHERDNYSKLLVDTYHKLTSDEEINKLLNFYKCYRAYIRGNINCFMLADENIPQEQKQNIKQTAQKYFKLAKSYAESL